MIYFCADDYGISKESNNRIEYCLENGCLNQISVLPNGEIDDLQNLLLHENVKLSLHTNLVEGHPLSDPKDIDLLVSGDGCFKYSFIGLFIRSFSPQKRRLENQVYGEIRKQICFWKEKMGESPISIDSHQHTHMIPLVFRAMLRAIVDEGVTVQSIRIPNEPLSPYFLTPSLYTSFNLTGFIKQWLLKTLAMVNKKQLKKSGFRYTCFMGVAFTGRMTKKKIEKLLPGYSKIARKHGLDIEITLHPGYVENQDSIMDGCREGFKRFYLSPWRKTEYDALINLSVK